MSQTRWVRNLPLMGGYSRRATPMLAVCIWVSFALSACSGGNSCEPDHLKIGLTPHQMIRGASASVAYTINEGGCSPDALVPTWSTSDPTSLSISAGTNQNATITAVGPSPRVTLRVEVYNQVDSVFIEVLAGPPTTIQISPSAPTLVVGSTQRMTAELRDAGGTVVDGAFAWSSSVGTVATVNSSGVVTAVSSGTTTISATYNGVTPNLVASTVVVVSAAPAASVVVTPATSTIGIGGTVTLTATAKDAQGNVLTGRNATWQSLSPTIATVGATTGVVTGVAVGGPVTIRVRLDENQAITADVTVTVASCANQVVFSDAFNSDPGANWTTLVEATNQFQTEVTDFQSSGGNSGGYRRMAHNMVGTNTIYVYHRREVEYDPSLPGNAIASINYSEDQITLPPSFSVAWGFFLEQNGVRYRKQIGTGVFTNTAWATGSIPNLRQADIPGVNFTASGGKIKFGFFRANTSTSGVYTVNHGIDNWRVEVCRQ